MVCAPTYFSSKFTWTPIRLYLTYPSIFQMLSVSHLDFLLLQSLLVILLVDSQGFLCFGLFYLQPFLQHLRHGHLPVLGMEFLIYPLITFLVKELFILPFFFPLSFMPHSRRLKIAKMIGIYSMTCVFNIRLHKGCDAQKSIFHTSILLFISF